MSKIQPKTKKVTIIKLTVANKETQKVGSVIELESSEANILINGGKAKEYEKGDEEKYKAPTKKVTEKKNA